MTRQEAGRLGGQALVKKYGVKHMSAIGKKGWQATLMAVAMRQNVSVEYGGNQFKNLLKNLKARKGR